LPRNTTPSGRTAGIRKGRGRAAPILLLLCLAGPASVRGSARAGDVAPRGAPFTFHDVTTESGLNRVILAGRPDKDHLLDSAGNGVAWLDYDADGLLDAYLVNAWRIEGSRIVERGRNALYRNLGGGRFQDVTAAAGVAGSGHWGSGVTVADVDADGRPDLLVTQFGPNLLYRNRGDGTFEDVAGPMGIQAPGWNTGAAFLDAEADGDLDLYIARYIRCSEAEVLAARPSLDWKGGEKVAFGPFGLAGARDVFFLNDGRGRFADATAAAGLEDRAEGFGFSVAAADLNGDGRQDLYVANDSDANYFYRNEGGGKFREVGLWAGNALDQNGAAQAGMGVAVGDADGDGHLDLLVTNFSQDFTTLYRGDGAGFFEDVSAPSGVGSITFLPLSWGTVIADLDNDGDSDLVIANGHIYPQVDRQPQFGMSFRQRNLLLENVGNGRFRDATDGAGPGFQVAESSRGLAAGDYDNDGDLDLLFSNQDAPPTLLRNDSSGGSWLAVRLVPAPGRPDPFGARVTVETAAGRQVQVLTSGGSYVSSHDPRLHFGLGKAASARRVTVKWPDGDRTELRDIAAGQLLSVSPPPPPPAGDARPGTP
jgi:hypothetical protein